MLLNLYDYLPCFPVNYLLLMRINLLLHIVNSLTEPSLVEPGAGEGAFPNSCVISTLFLKRAPLISSSVSPLGFLKFFFRLLDVICVLPVKIILQKLKKFPDIFCLQPYKIVSGQLSKIAVLPDPKF
jgi:hypothetical protein